MTGALANPPTAPRGVLIVTGTGTGVGKTVVTAAIAALARARDDRIAVVKPAQTGIASPVRALDAEPPDAETVRRLSGVTDLHELARFPDPLSPEAAARVSGLPPLDVADAAGYIARLADSRDLILVEGAGGLLVRYDPAGATIADLAARLGAPVLVVTAAALGTLNHTALTLEAIAARNLRLAGVVIGAWPRDPGRAERENLTDLAVLAGAPLAGLLPAGSGSLPPEEFRAVARHGLGASLGGWRSTGPLAAADGRRRLREIGRAGVGPCPKRSPGGNLARVSTLSGHAGAQAVAVAQQYGVTSMFTLSGGHVFPLYDGAVKASPPLRLVDVRHEQTAVFAAEATARLTRTPGLAVVTAGPGVTNSISAVTSAWFNGAPLVVLGGRASDYLWGQGALQELDHVPLLAPVTKRAWTEHAAAGVAASVDEAFRLALTPHRGPVFCDFPLEAIYGEGTADRAPGAGRPPSVTAPDPGDVAAIAGLLRSARRPVLVLGSEVWLGGAEPAARGFAETLRLPAIASGQARGVLPRGHPLLVTRARSLALAEADLVIVAGVPLDFRLRYGSFGPPADPAKVVHVADSAAGIATHCPLAASAAGDLTTFFRTLADACGQRPAGGPDWPPRLAEAAAAAAAADTPLLTSDAAPVHPMRIYGELLRVLDDDAVVIGDGGDFVSFAGRLVEPARPGRWLDPGPYGCLGTGLGYAIGARLAHPSSQVVLLLGDGAAGLCLMDADTLVRHNLPVVIIVGNNAAWGLEKGPMRAVYGYDVAADLRPGTRYDEVVRALGGAGELVTEPRQIAPALRRAFASAAPYLINVITDVSAAYPRTTTGV